MNLEHYLTFSDIRGKLGMVIPIWFPDETSEDEIVSILSLTMADAECIAEPAHQILVCDGQERVKELVDGMAKASQEPFIALLTEQNRGKGGAVAYGIDHLLSNSNVEYIVIRDADGDHFVNDAPNLARLAHQMRGELQDDNILVVGGRVDVHRPMGFVRGEYEKTINDVIWHALQYSLAREGRVINMQYFAEHGLIPDLHSGFKLYTRKSAETALNGLTAAQQGMPELTMMRNGSETVPLVEIVAHGGAVGQVNRITLETQPVMTFQNKNRWIRYGNRLLWTFLRLEIPYASAKQLLDNAIPRALLYKDANYLEELMQMRQHVLSGLGGTGDEPLFVHDFS